MRCLCYKQYLSITGLFIISKHRKHKTLTEQKKENEGESECARGARIIDATEMELRSERR